MRRDPVVQELEDGRIIKDDNGLFTELVDGEWVEPDEDFTIDDFINGRTPSGF